MIPSNGYAKIKKIVESKDNEMTPEEAATLLILVEKSGIMDKIKVADQVLRDAAEGKAKDFTSVYYCATDGKVKVYEGQTTVVDEARYALENPEEYERIMGIKRDKVKLALSDLDKLEAQEYGIKKKSTAKVSVVID